MLINKYIHGLSENNNLPLISLWSFFLKFAIYFIFERILSWTYFVNESDFESINSLHNYNYYNKYIITLNANNLLIGVPSVIVAHIASQKIGDNWLKYKIKTTFVIHGMCLYTFLFLHKLLMMKSIVESH